MGDAKILKFLLLRIHNLSLGSYTDKNTMTNAGNMIKHSKKAKYWVFWEHRIGWLTQLKDCPEKFVWGTESVGMNGS